MTRTFTIIAIAAAAALAGCNKQDNNIVGGDSPDPMADELANAAPVQLPPSIQASKSYRCRDNSLVFVDWLSDGASANLRTDKTGAPIQVRTAEAGKPMTADGGYSVSGTAAGSSVTVELPGKGSQSCKA